MTRHAKPTRMLRPLNKRQWMKIAAVVAAAGLLGAAGLALSSKEAPEELKIKVCSPGGTTIEGVHSFEQNELSRIVLEAAQASYRRTLELAGK